MPKIKISPEAEKEIAKRYNKGELIGDLARDFNCHHMTIRRHLKGKVGFRPLGEDVSRAKTKEWFFSDKQKDILEGLLLGDGCIPNSKNRERRKVFILSNNSKEFCLHTKNLMLKNHFNLFFNTQKSFHLAGKSCDFIKKLHKRWYKNEKVLPGNFNLNKTKLYYWYLCDGALINWPQKRSCIYLYTDGLNLKYVKRLSCQLKNLGFINKISKHNYATEKKEYGFAIRISSYSSKEFLNFIGKNKIKDYAYKWNHQIR